MIKNNLYYFFILLLVFASCKAPAVATFTPKSEIHSNSLADSLSGAHVGIAIRDAESGKWIEEYQSHKLFVPASNTKLLTLYAALKYLPDSLAGLRYFDAGDTIFAVPTGDPTLLMNDFENQPVRDWLLALKKPLIIDASNWKAEKYGRGWSWSDYDANYQPERSALPVNGNLMPVEYQSLYELPAADGEVSRLVGFLSMGPQGEERLQLDPDDWYSIVSNAQKFSIKRDYASNRFQVTVPLKDTVARVTVPFVTNGIETAIRWLRFLPLNRDDSLPVFSGAVPVSIQASSQPWTSITSQPLDSMLKPMMHRSDNFYAEQTLLMAANETLGYMSDAEMIARIMKNDFAGMPDKPVWVDGSGLSRYNLMSPANYVWLLQKMNTEFGLDRLKAILPTGNSGTLSNYYKSLSGKIFAKTGTLSGQVALSGFLVAKSGKLLIFSVLVNNHNVAATAVRRQVEQYLLRVWEEN